MHIQSFKEKLQDLLAENRLALVLRTLKKEIKLDSDLYSEFIQVKYRYNSIQDDLRAGVVTYENSKIQEAQIVSSISRFIQKLTTDDLKELTKTSENGIENPILIIATPDKIKELTDFFRKLQFANFTVTGTLPNKEFLLGFDLIIFDNTDLKSSFKEIDLEKFQPTEKNKIKERETQMLQVIQDTPRFLLHFGEHSYIVSNHRDRIHAANSLFALYARTKEVLDFINAYRV